MRVLALTALATVLATPLAAATCPPSTAEDGYYAAVESSELHAILVGDLEPLGPPDADGKVTALFSGEDMSLGWAPLTTEIAVQTACVDGACTPLEAMTDAVLYPVVDPNSGGFSLDMAACPTWAFDQVDPVMLSLVESAFSEIVESGATGAGENGEEEGAESAPVDETDGGPTDHEGQGADAP